MSGRDEVEPAPPRVTWRTRAVRIAKRLGKSLAVVVALVLVLVLVAVVALQTRGGRAFLLERLAPTLSSVLPGEIEVGSIAEARLGRITIRDLVIRDPDGHEVIRVGEARVRPNLGALLRGDLDFRSVEAFDVRVDLRVDDRGDLTIVNAFVDDSPASAPQSTPLSVFVRRAKIERGTVVLHMLGEPRIVLRDVGVRGSVSVTEHTRIIVDRLAFRSARGEAALLRTRGARAAYRTAPTETSSAFLRLSEREDVIDIEAHARNPREGEDANATELYAEIALAPLTTRLLDVFAEPALADSVPERIRADIRVTGTFARLRAAGNVRVGDETLAIDAHYVPSGDSRVALCTDGTTLAHLMTTLPAERVEGCFTIDAGVFTPTEMPIALTVRGAKLGTTMIPDMHVRAALRLDAGELTITSLVLPNVPVSTPPRIALEGRVGFAGDIDLTLALRRFDSEEDPAVRDALGGARFVMDADVAVRIGKPTAADAPSPLVASARVSARRISAAGVRVATVALDGNADGTTASPRFDVRARANDLDASGFVAERTDIHLHGTGDRAAMDLRAELPRDRTLQLHSDVHLTGDVVRGTARGSVGTQRDPWHLVIEGASFDTVTSAVRVRSAVLAHEASKIDAALALAGSGRVELDLVITSLAVHDLLAALSMPMAGLSLDVSGDAAVRGTTRIPTMHAALRFDDARYRDLEDLSATITLDYGVTEATLETRMTLGSMGAIALDGRADWRGPMPLARVMDAAVFGVTLDAAALDLELVGRIDPSARGLTGKLDGELALEGKASSPDLTMDLELTALTLPGVPLTSTGLGATIDGTWRDALVVALATSDEHGPLVRIDARLETPSRVLFGDVLALSEHAWSMEANLPARPLTEMPIDLGSLGTQPLVASATLSVAHDVGRPMRADLSGRVVRSPEEAPTTPATCGDAEGLALEILGTLRTDTTRVTLTLGDAATRPVTLALDARTPVDAWLAGEAAMPLVANLEGRVTALDLAAVPFVCEHATGMLDATIEGRDLGSTDATITLRADAPSMQFADDAPVAVHLDADVSGTRAHAKATVEARDGGNGIVEATLPFTWGPDGLSPSLPGGDLAITLRANDLSLEPIAGITPFIRRRAGTLDADLEVTGTVANPSPRGEVRLHDASLLMPGLGQRLTELEAHIALTPTRIVVQEFRARDVRGRVSLTGEATFEGSVPMRLEAALRATNFPVRQEGVIIADVTSVATLDLRRESDALRGDLVFASLDVNMPDAMSTGVQDLTENPDIRYLDAYPAGWEPPEAPPEGEVIAPTEVSDDSPFVPTYFEIDLRNPFWVRRSDFAIELDAELSLGVVETGVRLSGTVRTRRGFIELLGASFDIEEGTVRFPGGAEIDPVLDLSAVTNLGRENEVRVRIKGNLAALELTFYDRRQRELTAGLAVQCITTASCSELGGLSGGGDESQRAQDQAQSMLASLTVGLLTAAARHGLGDAIPRIGVSTGASFDQVTARVGFDANRLIPKFLRDIVLSLYIEGFISNESTDEARAEVQESSGRVSGGFLIELRHPRRLVTRGRYAPRSGWALDVTWQR